MKILPRIAFVAAVLTSLAAPALADPYKVKGLVEDETGTSPTDATAQARASSRMVGAQRLINRLTLPEDIQAAKSPVEASEIARLYKNIEFEAQEKTFAVAGGSRVTGVVTWNFDAAPIRQYLTMHGVPFVDSQAAWALMVPVVGPGIDPLSWGGVWQEPNASGVMTAKKDDTLLTPYISSVKTLDHHPTWDEVAAEAGTMNTPHAVVAEVYNQGGIFVRLSDLRPNAAEAAIALAGPFADLTSARDGALDALQRAYKVASIVRTSGSTSMQITASFHTIDEWVRIQKGLEGSRLISNLTTESISPTGADISFVFSGRPDQLAGDLRSRGVDLHGADNGWVAQAVGAQ